MSSFAKEIVSFVQAGLKERACAEKAPAMAAYMKNRMPFYGVQKPERMAIYKHLKKHFVPADRKEYEAAIKALWKLSMREERYTAIEFAKMHNQFVTVDSLALYEQMIRDGAWWDLVDDLAIQIVSCIYRAERKTMKPIIEKWVNDDDMWIRRTAILAHNHHKKETDSKQLFAHCLLRADEEEFFIRKAIGWALREYSYTDPKAVSRFLISNRKRLSGLSFREGAKQLIRSGQLLL
ncbi:MAG: DNA alkylation repair protein [Candidatus Obscuribacterales bacterium]|nr:DNA alkylation repair protein [Candidatus Obscuribacterales bacterium]